MRELDIESPEDLMAAVHELSWVDENGVRKISEEDAMALFIGNNDFRQQVAAKGLSIEDAITFFRPFLGQMGELLQTMGIYLEYAAPERLQ